MHWKRKPRRSLFLLTPLREGRPLTLYFVSSTLNISTHAPAGGATKLDAETNTLSVISTHAPAGGATLRRYPAACRTSHFYSRPCGRGDQCEGTPLFFATYFYSRPCGRGDKISVNGLAVDAISTHAPAGGATIHIPERNGVVRRISTHAPAGGATTVGRVLFICFEFLLTPLREGRRKRCKHRCAALLHFYSRPCGRGDDCFP